MTKEEAIHLLVNATYSDEWQGNEDLQTAQNMAIKALEQVPNIDMGEIKEIVECDADLETKYNMISNILTAKPHYFEKQETCEDAVSRQSVKEGMIKYGFRSSDMTVTEFVEDVLQLATTRKKGKWTFDDGYPDSLICNKCRAKFDIWHWEQKQMHYCPNCGAEMEVEE